MSVSPAILRALGALKLNRVQMAGVLGLLADAAEAEQSRLIEQRDRKRASRNKSVTGPVTVTGQSRDSHMDKAVTVTVTAPPPKENPQTPKEITPPTSKTSVTSVTSQKRPACRLPHGFQPDVRWAEDLGLTPQMAANEAAQFQDYWNAKAGPDSFKRDWPAAWRTWARRKLQETPPRLRVSGNGFATSPPVIKDTPANAANRRIEEIEERERQDGQTQNYQPAPRPLQLDYRRGGD